MEQFRQCLQPFYGHSAVELNSTRTPCLFKTIVWDKEAGHELPVERFRVNKPWPKNSKAARLTWESKDMTKLSELALDATKIHKGYRSHGHAKTYTGALPLEATHHQSNSRRCPNHPLLSAGQCVRIAPQVTWILLYSSIFRNIRTSISISISMSISILINQPTKQSIHHDRSINQSIN